MTSLRYLNDKTDSKDLVRSFIKVIPYAVIAIIVLSIQHIVEVVKLVASPEFKMAKASAKTISYFGNGGFLDPTLILFGMVLCGIIMAFTLFRFMLTKKSVNVYFSMGITRTRLYFNRITAGVLALLLAVMIPMITVLLINLASFGASAHLFEVFLYESSLLFVSGLAGFAIATVASAFSGSIAEMALNTAAISLAPSIISMISRNIKEYLLKGYTGMYGGANYLVEVTKGRAFSPWQFAVDLDVSKVTGTSSNMSELFLSSPYFDMADKLEKTVPENKMLDMGLMLPIIIWVIISAVLIALGYLLINKRKAEHSNSFGKFYISSAVLGTTAYLGASAILLGLCGELYNNQYLRVSDKASPFFHNAALCLIIAVIALTIVFFVVELIVRRKIKSTVRMWPVFAGLLVLTLFAVGFFASGEFGKYNKAPVKTEVKEVAIDIYDPQSNFATHVLSNKAYLSSDESDIEFAIDQFKKISASKTVDGKDSSTVTFKFVLKDKSVMMRKFEVFDSALFEEYMRSVFSTNYYKSNMKYLMLEEPEAYSETDENGDMYYYDDGFGGRVYYSDGDRYSKGMLKAAQWRYASSDCIVDNAITVTDEGGISGNNTPIFDDNDALMKALYNDLTKMSFDERYMNTKRPVGVLYIADEEAHYADGKYVVFNDYGYYTTMSEDEYERYHNENFVSETKVRASYPAVYNGCFFIYDNMSETVALLKEHGFDVSTHAAKVKEVYYTDSKFSCSKAMNTVMYELSKVNKDYDFWGNVFNEGNLVTELFTGSTELNALLYNDYFGYVYGESSAKTLVLTEMLNKVYDEAKHPLIKAENAEKAQAIADKSVPFFCNYKDDGRYAFVIYEDNVITCSYIPSANIDVLK
ncbi:MAG: hypothetical protein IJK26_06570 [Clostridia bacterium]|nr:hypothetical protein [Clostridia bacterium]